MKVKTALSGLRLFLIAPLLLLAAFAGTGCRDNAEEIRVVRIDPAVAAQMADSITQTVSVELAEGLDLRLWAVDSLAPDPIALHFDDRGRAYITRTVRQKHSEFDIRGHRAWMIESIGLETVEDRRAFLRREFAPERSDSNAWLEDLNGDGSHDWQDLAVEQEEVYRIEDTDGDGVADLSRVILRDFNEEVTDIAGAFMTHGDHMYIGVAPDVWRLRDRNGDGLVDEKTSISHGYGVHIGFSGHNISGLTVGPDGRIYWSIGDIGLNVTDAEGRQWAYPNEGAILRSNPDGSGFEVFATGIRNTHEFVFDEFGNLISVDNDGDHPGEHERIVYLVEGSDSGWRANWQYGKYEDPRNNEYKVWMDEEMFRPRFEGQAAYITPPIAAYHSGPAGMAYNPGTALGEAWRNTFFMAEFTGSPARSRVFGFRLKPSGASFELADEREVTRGILAVGVDIGPDGALYIGDWMEGWGTKDVGRIWKVDVAGADTSTIRRETMQLLAADLSDRRSAGLYALLQHPDLRVRQRAQFALAERGADAELLRAAKQTEHRLARVHGVWGIWQLALENSDAAEPLVYLLTDLDPEIRAQAARVLGDVGYTAAAEFLIPLLADPEPRVRFFAAQALGQLEHRDAAPAVIAMLRTNDDADAYLRHAGALALARMGDAQTVLDLANHPSRAVRIAAVVALRRMRHAGISRFLLDNDDFIVTEAARAINDDGGIEEAIPDLAMILNTTPFENEALVRRAINANLRVGTPEAAERVAEYAAGVGGSPALRAEAVAALGVWPSPSKLDRVDGWYLGALERDTSIATAAIADRIEALLRDPIPAVSIAAAQAVGRLRYEPASAALLEQLERSSDSGARIAALEGLQAMNSPRLESAVQFVLSSGDPMVRMHALQLVPTLQMAPDAKADLLGRIVLNGTRPEQQSAVLALGALESTRARGLLQDLLWRLEAGRLNPAIQLEVMEAIAVSGSADLQRQLEAFRASRPADDVVAKYSESLSGGDPRAGARVVFRHATAQCMRCHAIGGQGESVGPDLQNVGSRLTHEQLLRSLVQPGAEIAPGYGDEDAPSSMPPMGDILTRREIRDVVAFLATLREGVDLRAGR